jgi:hypothetical protein
VTSRFRLPFAAVQAAARLLTLLALCAPGATLAGPASEYQVKAVFVFNFSQFVSWPPEAFDASGAPLVIGVLGRDPFGPDLDAVVAGEHVGTRPLVVRRYHDVAEVRSCHILFIARSEAPQLDAVLKSLRGRGILTVSDIEDAARRGVMIDFVTENSRIRLQINESVARSSGLTISSKLLRPAQIVDSQGQ